MNRFTKKEREALERSWPNELEQLARTARSDAYYAYLDGRNVRSTYLERKADHFDEVRRRKEKEQAK